MRTGIIAILLFFAYICHAQTVFLYTPNGSQVYAYNCSEMNSADIAKYASDMAKQYPKAEILAPASNTYNCHSYAWNILETGPVCWLNQYPDLHFYWDDGSYVEATEDNTSKIFYYNGDHSAVKSITHTGKYESKWGPGPLMRHSPTYGPSIYKMQDRKYYHSCTFSLTGAITQSKTGCDVTVNNATIGANANVTITGTNIIEINSLTTADGAWAVFDNGVPVYNQTYTTSTDELLAEAVYYAEELTAAGTAAAIEEKAMEPETRFIDNTAKLYQNTPNPFTGQTVIGYYLPEGAGDAWLRIMNTSGMVVKTVNITASGNGSAVLDANALSPGIYFYSLMLNGEAIDTKRMAVE